MQYSINQYFQIFNTLKIDFTKFIDAKNLFHVKIVQLVSSPISKEKLEKLELILLLE